MGAWRQRTGLGLAIVGIAAGASGLQPQWRAWARTCLLPVCCYRAAHFDASTGLVPVSGRRPKPSGAYGGARPRSYRRSGFPQAPTWSSGRPDGSAPARWAGGWMKRRLDGGGVLAKDPLELAGETCLPERVGQPRQMRQTGASSFSKLQSCAQGSEMGSPTSQDQDQPARADCKRRCSHDPEAVLSQHAFSALLVSARCCRSSR